MYEAIKSATGPSIQSCSVLKRKDGAVIADKPHKLDRWTEHYSERYGGDSNTCYDTLSKLPETRPREHPILMK